MTEHEKQKPGLARNPDLKDAVPRVPKPTP